MSSIRSDRDFKIPEASLDEDIAGAGAQYSTLSELEENKVHHNLRHLSIRDYNFFIPALESLSLLN